ncbi:tryptophan-rich sensory protein [Methanobacterium alcaliphilum]|nr:TspO/MBR family protein [Methanobacterium alcaliphilum]MCK9150717.1 tryptophan-rich sensory protein [Methanobacterium alcaliphilum]
MEKFKVQDLPKLVASFFAVFLAAFIGNYFTFPEITTWYVSLVKPVWTPPNWVFGPVWTTLYILMAVALFLVWRQGLERKEVKYAILIFAVQLILNMAWSIVFFGMHNILGGFAVILILWVAILANIFAFYIVSKPAGLLLVPYIIWVSIASYLNYSVYLLN